MPKILISLAFGTLLALYSFTAAAVSIQWVPESGDALTTVGGHPILEYNDTFYDPTTGSTGDWTVGGTGSYSGSATQLWLLTGTGLNASTTFTVPSTGVSFMMDGDHNDGFADFFVDGSAVATNVDLYFLGWQSLVVTGLSLAPHTLQVVLLNIANPASLATHVAIFGGAAIPEPGTIALLGAGLAGLGFGRRHNRRRS